MRLIARPEAVPPAGPTETDVTLFLFWTFSAFRGAPIGPNGRARRADQYMSDCPRVLDFRRTRFLSTPVGGAEFDAACIRALPAQLLPQLYCRGFEKRVALLLVFYVFHL